MTITWLGHSCFALESGDFRIVVDPYQGVEGLPDTDTWANAVFCSHQHGDHSYVQGVQIKETSPSPFMVREVPACHDDQNGSLRGQNTIRCFSAQGHTVVHLGDLGHILSEEQIRAVGPCDVLLLPIGGYYTIDAAAAKTVAEQLHPRVVIPMHYRHGTRDFAVLDTVESFTALWPREQIFRCDTNVFHLNDDTCQQVAVLTYAE